MSVNVAEQGERCLLGSELNELPDDSSLVRPYVTRLRQAAQAELRSDNTPDFSDPFLVKFLRARDFDVEPALKVIWIIAVMDTFKYISPKS